MPETQASFAFEPSSKAPQLQKITEDCYLLKGYAVKHGDKNIQLIHQLAEAAPFRQMQTPGGHTMSVSISNCGHYGWISDRHGYRYAAINPDTERPWPALPENWKKLAHDAANCAGFADFNPDVCLINRYAVGSKMGLHQDKDEEDFSQPIVSVSLGLPILFVFGGAERQSPVQSVLLEHGDVMVWGGKTRLNFHGVRTLKAGHHPVAGPYRFNLTFRRAR
jgi:alkylated DNA repair protein (DNA oxidative demethylase)